MATFMISPSARRSAFYLNENLLYQSRPGVLKNPIRSYSQSGFTTEVLNNKKWVQGRILLRNHYYTTKFSTNMKIPVVVHQNLNSNYLHGSVKGRFRWQLDPRLDELQQASFALYKEGWERYQLSKGHMAPGGDYSHSSQARRSTYLLSNALPQYEACNMGSWKEIEELCRNLLKQQQHLDVFSGPLLVKGPHDSLKSWKFLGKGSTQQQVLVPPYLFKVISVPGAGEGGVQAYIVPNSADALRRPIGTYETSLEEIIELSLLRFEFSAQGSLKPLEAQIGTEALS